MRTYRIFLGLVVVWAMHSVVYLTLLGQALALSGRGTYALPGWMAGTLKILGQPLMPLVPRLVRGLGPNDLGAGGGAHWLVAMALVNALLWAAVIVGLARALVRRISRANTRP